MLLIKVTQQFIDDIEFQWAPTLGGECYNRRWVRVHWRYSEFQWAPTLGGECYRRTFQTRYLTLIVAFQWAPTLGGECYEASSPPTQRAGTSFNGHPPLGVNATQCRPSRVCYWIRQFQWAPTLGGECYKYLISPCFFKYTSFQWAPTLGGECYVTVRCSCSHASRFQWAPTLGGECYWFISLRIIFEFVGFNGHPPLGVNATPARLSRSQSAGLRGFNGHPPLGVNATRRSRAVPAQTRWVSMGTHPWG